MRRQRSMSSQYMKKPSSKPPSRRASAGHEQAGTGDPVVATSPFVGIRSSRITSSVQPAVGSQPMEEERLGERRRVAGTDAARSPIDRARRRSGAVLPRPGVASQPRRRGLECRGVDAASGLRKSTKGTTGAPAGIAPGSEAAIRFPSGSSIPGGRTPTRGSHPTMRCRRQSTRTSAFDVNGSTRSELVAAVERNDDDVDVGPHGSYPTAARRRHTSPLGQCSRRRPVVTLLNGVMAENPTSRPLQLPAQDRCRTDLLHGVAPGRRPASRQAPTCCVSRGRGPAAARGVEVADARARPLRVPYRALGQLRALRLHDRIVARRLRSSPGNRRRPHLAARRARDLGTARRLGIPTVLERPNAHTRLRLRGRAARVRADRRRASA